MKSEYKTIAVLAVAVILVGAIVWTVSSDEGEADVKIGLVAWDCAIASSHVTQLVLEEAGYNVELVYTDAGPLYAGLVRGDVDVTTTAWVPHTHQAYIDAFGDDLTTVATNLEGAKIGWVAPDYTMDAIRTILGEGPEYNVTIADLDNAAVADLFRGGDENKPQVIGIEPGAGLMQSSENAMNNTNYNLAGWELVQSSSAAMAASLGSAVDADEHIIVTLWSPHWAFGAFAEYDLTYFEDPLMVFGDPADLERIDTIANPDFVEDNPEIVEILERFYWTMADIESAMALQQEHGNTVGAQMWIDDNRALVDAWLGL